MMTRRTTAAWRLERAIAALKFLCFYQFFHPANFCLEYVGAASADQPVVKFPTPFAWPVRQMYVWSACFLLCWSQLGKAQARAWRQMMHVVAVACSSPC